MLTGREKIYFVVNSIFNKSQTTPKGKPININRTLDLNNRIPTEELKDIMQILEKDEGVIVIERKIDKAAEYMFNNRVGTYIFDLTSRFESFFRMMRKEEAYQRYAGINRKPSADTGQSQNNDLLFWITYSPKRDIILNDYFQIGKPYLDSENDAVFDFLYRNPNRKVQTDELLFNIKRENLTKDLDKIVDNLGFKRGLEKIFFEMSKTTIIFRNPITREQYSSMRLGLIELRLK